MDYLPDLPPPPILPRSLQRKPTAITEIVTEPEPIPESEFAIGSESTLVPDLTPDPEPILEPESPPEQKSSTQRKSAPERLPKPSQGEASNQKPQDTPPQSVEEELACYILAIQEDHETEIGFLQRDLHRERTKRIHQTQEHIRETETLKAQVQDLTAQLEAIKASIPGTFENKCSSLQKLTQEFPQIKTKELAILVCETYSTIDLLNLLNPLGSSSEPVTKKRYGNDSKIWCSVFLTYVEILHSLYSQTYPGLLSQVLKFHREILQLAERYSWKDQVLPLALFHHGMVRKNDVTKAENWEIPETTRRRFCPEPVVDVVSVKEQSFKMGKGKENEKKEKRKKPPERLTERDFMLGYTPWWERLTGIFGNRSSGCLVMAHLDGIMGRGSKISN
ncbi:hypothetical protein HYALB_00000886 [Hymenoscyphus albidus]|uniref:Uncharacterized protein n=1 Tax=Hymenoscyphus albidus TaxID=595503 RepID=A0A9N9Q121_9HELO|nr:hypothetical protein HYALB_00000886 [Hymenoscyphus albidus]